MKMCETFQVNLFRMNGLFDRPFVKTQPSQNMQFLLNLESLSHSITLVLIRTNDHHVPNVAICQNQAYLRHSG